MVGRAIALDLATDHSVTSFDLAGTNLEELKSRNSVIDTAAADLSDTSMYDDLLKPFDLVVTAVPGFMGYKTLEAVINAGKDVVDISFFPEDALQLDKLAKEKNVTVIPDCGVAPGMSNLILGFYDSIMKVDSFACYVGGLTVERKPPFQYKAPFSPVDVIQEYIRPARIKEHGEIVTRPAMSEREIIHFDKIGDLQAFNTDGLRSLLLTMGHIPDMKEKTLRYPGHIDLIISLQQAGFFDVAPLRFGDTDISPLELTSRLLVNQWKLDPGENEFTIMRVIIKGEGKTVEYNMLDYFDPASSISSMARTTGYTCTAVVSLLAKKLFSHRGVCPPEIVGKEKGCFEFVLGYLNARGVNWEKSIY